MIETLIFDLDGVLWDSKLLHFKALNKALVYHDSLPISEAEQASTFEGLPTKVKVNKLVELGRVKPLLFYSILYHKQLNTEALMTKTLKCSKYYKSLLEAFALLKLEGFNLILASNCIRSTVDTFCKNTKLGSMFDFTLSNQDVANPKPSADIYIEAMKRARKPSSSCLIFEDSPVGLIAAKASRAHVKAVLNGPDEVTYDFIKQAIKEVENV